MSLKLVSPFLGLESIVRENYPLKRHTWYRVGGPARYFIQPQSVEQLSEAIRRCAEHAIPVYILGLGANLLVRDEGVDGAVFRLDAEAFETIQVEGNKVHVGAGVDLQKLIVKMVRDGLAGIETLAGIPGTIGGTIRMNAGGKFGDLGTVVESVTTMDHAGRVTQHDRDEVVFGYRSSNLADPLILGATLSLELEDPEAILPRYKEIWMYKRNTQPLNTRNSGCIFKNPTGSLLSAGALIDKAGLKGTRIGRAEVSEKHANFIVADPDCPSADVLSLIKHVQDEVTAKHGVNLTTEVQIWPPAERAGEAG